MEKILSGNTNDFIENLITSYESRIRNIEIVFNQSDAINESSFSLLKNFGNSLNDYKTERETINSRLRDNLAKNGSLRKKDYDRMMERILNELYEKEVKAENCLHQFIEDQKAMTEFLKIRIFEIKDNLRQDNTEEIKAFRQELSRISCKLEIKKKIFIQQFMECQHLHQKVIGNFKMLLSKGDHIAIRDVKEIHQNLLGELV